MSPVRILIVDDELAIRQVLAEELMREGYEVADTGDGESALDYLLKNDVDIAICDVRMPGMSGIDVLRKVREAGIDTSFLLMTAFASVDTAIESMKLGAFDYLIKPVRSEEVLHQVRQIADMRGLRDENRRLRQILLGASEDRCRLGSQRFQEIERLVDRVAGTESTVLITGESGTGKTVIAREIHRLSTRANGPFIPVNCGSIPENLLESEFFGHTKGAFTGADRAKKGLFAEASGGTLLLDEIGELPQPLQVKLLHVLEDKEFRPVGGGPLQRADVRVIAATNRDLSAMVQAGEFREDLFFRLNVFQIHIPPLRERREDINTLVRFFIKRHAAEYGRTEHMDIDPQAEALLTTYDWPGNIRELENTIARALILAEGNRITANDLPAHIAHTKKGDGEQIAPAGGSMSLKESVRAFEYNLIMKTIEDMGGDRRAAAQRLGIGLSTLYRKIEEFEHQRESGNATLS